MYIICFCLLRDPGKSRSFLLPVSDSPWIPKIANGSLDSQCDPRSWDANVLGFLLFPKMQNHPCLCPARPHQSASFSSAPLFSVFLPPAPIKWGSCPHCALPALKRYPRKNGPEQVTIPSLLLVQRCIRPSGRESHEPPPPPTCTCAASDHTASTSSVDVLLATFTAKKHPLPLTNQHWDFQMTPPFTFPVSPALAANLLSPHNDRLYPLGIPDFGS